jgi:hypothetical protein
MIFPLILKPWLDSYLGRTSPTNTMASLGAVAPTTIIRAGRGGANGTCDLSQAVSNINIANPKNFIFIPLSLSFI